MTETVLGSATKTVVIGFERRKKAKDGTLVAATPVVAPGFAGASLRVRF